MGEIKSAFEKAMERAERLGKASAEELGRLEYIPQGNALAARYLAEEPSDLKAELGRFDESTRKFVIEGVEETLLRNITLPHSNHAQQTAKKAMEGILTLKERKTEVRKVFGQIEHLFNYYQQARQQNYLKLKENFDRRLAEARKTAELQLGSRARIDAENHPQFREEWLKLLSELNAQYERVLEEQKSEIKKLK